MKKIHYILLITIVAIVAVIIFNPMDFNIANYNYYLIDDSDEFEVRIDSNGRDIFYMWNNRLQHITSGQMKVDAYYVGEKHLILGEEIKYKVDLGLYGNRDSTSKVKNINNIHIIDYENQRYIKNYEDDYRVEITIGADTYIVPLIEE